MNPIALSTLLAGGAANVLGGIFGRNEALSNAKRQAEASNASLAANIAKLQGFADTNANTFGTNIARYAPDTQGPALEAAQTKRGDINASNISAPDTNAAPISADASPAVKGEIAKRILATHNAAVERAKATGTLGGYTDAWAANELGNNQANRDIGVTNNYAEGRKALIGPESDLAAAAAYKPPSIWSTLLSGVGSLASAAGGSALGRPTYGNDSIWSTFFQPSGPDKLPGQTGWSNQGTGGTLYPTF